MLTRMRRPPAEKKILDRIDSLAAVAVAGNLFFPWQIAQGTAPNQRVGYKVKPWSWSIRLLMTNHNPTTNSGAPVVLRIIVGYDKNAQLASPAVSDIIQPVTNPVLDPLQVQNFGRFKILMDRRVTWNPKLGIVQGLLTDGTGAISTAPLDLVAHRWLFIKGSRLPPITWNFGDPAAGAVIKTRPFVLFLQSGTTDTVSIVMFQRMRFIDV